MSISVERKRNGKPRYRVRWKTEQGKWRSQSFDHKRDAEAFEAKIKLAKRQGELGNIDRPKTTFHDFSREWWRQYAAVHLGEKTRQDYRRFLDKLLIPRIGTTQLGKLDTQRVTRLQADLRADGVGKETVRKTIAMLQGMMARAVEWGYLQVNPVTAVRKLPQGRTKLIRPLAPETVERMRAKLLSEGRPRDAALICTLAYSGLRPGEALALRWSDVGAKVITVDKAASLGTEKDTKTGQSRTVRLLAPLRDDLAAWRTAAAGEDSGLVFPTRGGDLWDADDWRNWHRRVYRPLALGVGIEDARPYDLRHSFASLLFHEQKLAHHEIAAQLGHNMQTLFTTYTHVIEELRGKRGKSAESLILASRAKESANGVASKLPHSSGSSNGNRSKGTKNPA